MQLLTRREYNLILRSLDSYNYLMNNKEKELSETLQDKLYYNLYNPKDGVARTEAQLPDINIDLEKLLWPLNYKELLGDFGDNAARNYE